MKRLLAILVLFSAFSINSIAQSPEFARESNNYLMGIGPVIGFKMGVNAAEVPDGVKNGVAAAAMPDFGAQFYMPFDPENKMGLIIDAVYANYPYLLKTGGAELTDRFQYFGLGANFFLSGFTVGFNFGFPLGGERSTPAGELEIDAAQLNTMIEFRIGGNFTLNESNFGRLVLFINAGYQINGQYTDEMNQGTYNPHPASLQLGLGYILNLQ
ncbi:MAG: hypothetical protein KIT33_09725 [Candidatus Kapabacteria bacterium]|nr:hypothetical protein [Ignavibacteriota bacterium]MCW5885236.1 hypothetical protein [Candidatus Kapabacteria bacterium]